MATLKVLFRDEQSFEKYIKHSDLEFNKNCLIRIYTAICDELEIIEISKIVKKYIPFSKIIGGSCCGVVYNGEQFDNETLIIIEQFDNIELETNSYTFKNKTSYEIANEINSNIKDLEVPLMHILFGEHYIDIHQFVEDFNSINNKTKLIGGATGEILPKNFQPFVFFEDRIIKDGVVTASYISKDLSIYTDVNTAVEPISSVYNLDTCDGEALLKIENLSSIEWCKNIFGIGELKDTENIENSILTLFPLILEKYNCNDVTRFIKYEPSIKNITLYCSKLENNTKFKIGYISPFKCVQKMYEICNFLKKKPLENLFFYSCLFRKSFLGNCAKWEISPFGKDICGVFMMGEISNINNRNEFFNGSCCFVGTSENSSKYIDIDFAVFDDLYKIKDENERILNIILKKHNTAISEQNKQLLEKFIAQQYKAEDILYIDPNLKISNSIKFTLEKHSKKFNKMCILQLENSELIISRMEKEEYYLVFRNIINSLKNFIQNYAHYNNECEIYSLNDSTIFLAVNDNLDDNIFIKFVNEIYENFQFIKIKNREELLIFRFAIVENEENLLECGLETLQKCKSLQTYFLVYDKESNTEDIFDNEMEIIHLLNDAIKKDWVIPYFQGIYDNKNKKINKYESLIRIKDDKGNLYGPGYFMDVAKKYNIYSTLSKIMINKVFLLFKDKKTNVSLNLSAYDINSPSVQETIFKNLDTINNENFIFELLEDECFRNIEMLNDFIKNVKEYNIKIAIDDFGTGYSNFMEIARISPDFIKIDGSIIKNIDSDDINKKVLNNIVFLGKQLEAQLIAEFVENESIQNVLNDLQVDFSQGYYFAKPEPFENIKDNLE